MISNATLGKNIHGLPQLQPLKRYEESGHKNGVGKKCSVWSGMSVRIWSGHANISHRGFLRMSHTAKNIAEKIIKLCVGLYKKCT